MWQRNNGQSEAEKLQNRFTSYLVTAVNRRRKDYMNQRSRRICMESYLEDEAWYLEFDKQLHSNLPLLLQLENDALVSALKQITERERHVFFLMSWRTRALRSLPQS